MTEKLLWRRGNQWYFRLPIPRPLQARFPSASGKPKNMIALPLGDSLTVWRRAREELTVLYRRVFDRIAAGETMTQEQINEATSMHVLAVDRHGRKSSEKLVQVGSPRWYEIIETPFMRHVQRHRQWEE